MIEGIALIALCALASGCIGEDEEGVVLGDVEGIEQLSNESEEAGETYTEIDGSEEENAVSNLPVDDVEPLAPGGATDYSYFSAVDICEPYDGASDLEFHVDQIRNTNASTRYVTCTFPLLFMNVVGYDASEISEIVVYGRNRNNNSAYNYPITLYARGSTETSQTSYGTEYLSYTASAITYAEYDVPDISYYDPYVSLYIGIPGDDEGESILDHFRVFYVE